MDFRLAPKKRTSNFREDETRLLIQLWGSPTVQNKLYLTHRKAPVMRLIAANMQRHGFYRTPDEVKTRIRNLKCLYHRIKKSMTTGTGVGTVDPDWPHYKAMDEILSKKNALRQSLVYNSNLLSEVNSAVKDELEDIELNDDGESLTSTGSDDEFEELPPDMPATITPLIIEEEEESTSKNSMPVKILPKPPASPTPTPTPRIKIAQNLLSPVVSSAPTTPSKTVNIVQKPQVSQIQTIQTVNLVNGVSSQNSVNKIQATSVAGNNVKVNTINSTVGNTSNLPFPLLILNGMPNGVQGVQSGQPLANGLQMQKALPVNTGTNFNAEVSNILREMLSIQKENLNIERERLEVERQKLEYERTIGVQLLNMVPTLNQIFQSVGDKEQTVEEEDTKNFAEHPDFKKQMNDIKRLAEDPLEPLKNGKIFKVAVLDGIRKYMQDGTALNSDTDGDSGIANDSM